MKLLFALFVCFAFANCEAQTAPVAAKDAFTKNFPGITVKKWDKEDGNYEANFVKDGKQMSATFSADGTLEETETGMKINDLPYSVTSFIEKKYNGAHIKEASIIVKGDSKMYEAEVKGKDLLFDMQGKFLREEED